MQNYSSELLFFSGGTALYTTSRALMKWTRNTVHLITPFDSGGSTAVLRDIFTIPAVGDIRNRLLALIPENKEYNNIKALLEYRLPDTPSDSEIDTFYTILQGKHPLWDVIFTPIKKGFLSYLSLVLPLLPKNFSMSRACIGNYILVGAILASKKFSHAIKDFSKLLGIKEIILPVVEDNLYLVALLQDGSFIHGQHYITQKKELFTIVELYLTDEKPDSTKTPPKPVEAFIDASVDKYIRNARKICYSMGSFYTSLLAGLIPKGISEAIIYNKGPKIYIPNMGKDFEQASMPVESCVEKLIELLSKNTSMKPSSFVSHVILDPRKSAYMNGINEKNIKSFGIKIIHSYCLRSKKEYDPDVLAQLLMSKSVYT